MVIRQKVRAARTASTATAAADEYVLANDDLDVSESKCEPSLSTCAPYNLATSSFKS